VPIRAILLLVTAAFCPLCAQTHANYYRMKKVTIVDERGFDRPMPAMTLLIPEDWQFQGNVQYNRNTGCHPDIVGLSVSRHESGWALRDRDVSRSPLAVDGRSTNGAPVARVEPLMTVVGRRVLSTGTRSCARIDLTHVALGAVLIGLRQPPSDWTYYPVSIH
jgi:hypothetical protein